MPSSAFTFRRAAFAALLAASWATAANAGATSFQDLGALDPAAEGIFIEQSLTQGPDGRMYGVSPNVGQVGNGIGGAVFRVEGDGRLTVVHTFDVADGYQPEGPLTLGADGWLYGTTFSGSSGGFGEVFKISPAGELVVVHAFSPSADGGMGYPHDHLVPDGQGGFYGLAEIVGVAGVIFHLTADARLSMLAEFAGSHVGALPTALTSGPDGVLYGATLIGPPGSPGSGGTVFSLRPGGRLKTLHVLDSSVDGASPGRSMAIGGDNAVYGAATSGGASGMGTIFRVTPAGAFKVIHTFYTGAGAADPLGGYPNGVTSSADGRLYGTSSGGGAHWGGTAWSMSLDGRGSVLHGFLSPYGVAGCKPMAVPTWTPDGALWGVTDSGATFDDGAVFRIGLGPK